MIKFRFVILIFLVLSFNIIFTQPVTRFAAIGDYGRWYTPGEGMVSQMIHGWNPDFIITLGDNNYEYGADSTIDSNVGQYYHDYIRPYFGVFGNEAPYNKFYPSIGNHDWITDSAHAYLNFFTLPGNERYYDYIIGNCHFFVIDSDINEPDGNTSSSIQALWLRNKLFQSASRFKIVYFHHPPYSSGQHGNSAEMQWPFKEWGATVVLCGHEHNYERLVGEDGMSYFVNGLGGKDWREFATIVPESRLRFTANYGAMLVTSYADSINFKFIAYPDSIKDDTTFILPPIGIEPISEVASEFKLEQNYPNPFNPVTKIKFEIPAFVETTRRVVYLRIYDVRGKEIAILINKELKPGTYEVEWDAAVYPSGIYFYTLNSATVSITRKMILMK